MGMNDAADYMYFIDSTSRYLKEKLDEANEHIRGLYAQIESLENEIFSPSVSAFLSHVKIATETNNGRRLLTVEVDRFNSIPQHALVNHLNRYIDRVVFPQLREDIIKAFVIKK